MIDMSEKHHQTLRYPISAITAEFLEDKIPDWTADLTQFINEKYGMRNLKLSRIDCDFIFIEFEVCIEDFAVPWVLLCVVVWLRRVESNNRLIMESLEQMFYSCVKEDDVGWITRQSWTDFEG